VAQVLEILNFAVSSPEPVDDADVETGSGQISANEGVQANDRS